MLTLQPGPVSREASTAHWRPNFRQRVSVGVFAGVLDMLGRRAHRKAYPVLVGTLAFPATLSMSVPLVPVLSEIALLATLGSGTESAFAICCICHGIHWKNSQSMGSPRGLHPVLVFLAN